MIKLLDLNFPKALELDMELRGKKTSSLNIPVRQLCKFCLAALLVTITLPFSALAYIDAGSGSMLLQLLLAGLAGAAVMIKLWWNHLKLLFRRKKDDK